MTDEQKVIKLSPEQILAKKVQLINIKQSVEASELTIKQFEDMLKDDFLILQTQDMINREKQKIEIAKHNIIALTEQVEKGEM